MNVPVSYWLTNRIFKSGLHTCRLIWSKNILTIMPFSIHRRDKLPSSTWLYLIYSEYITVYLIVQGETACITTSKCHHKTQATCLLLKGPPISLAQLASVAVQYPRSMIPSLASYWHSSSQAQSSTWPSCNSTVDDLTNSSSQASSSVSAWPV